MKCGSSSVVVVLGPLPPALSAIYRPIDDVMSRRLYILGLYIYTRLMSAC